MKSQGNMPPPKDDIYLSVTEPRDMEIYSYLMKNSKIAVLRKLSELQENTVNSTKTRAQYMNKM